MIAAGFLPITENLENEICCFLSANELGLRKIQTE